MRYWPLLLLPLLCGSAQLNITAHVAEILIVRTYTPEQEIVQIASTEAMPTFVEIEGSETYPGKFTVRVKDGTYSYSANRGFVRFESIVSGNPPLDLDFSGSSNLQSHEQGYNLIAPFDGTLKTQATLQQSPVEIEF